MEFASVTEISFSTCFPAAELSHLACLLAVKGRRWKKGMGVWGVGGGALQREGLSHLAQRAGVGWPASTFSFLKVCVYIVCVGGERVPRPAELHLSNHCPGKSSP